jgi:hypothetical protein
MWQKFYGFNRLGFCAFKAKKKPRDMGQGRLRFNVKERFSGRKNGKMCFENTIF